MCGIAGVAWYQPDRLPDFPEFRRMVDVLSHRGPDDSGFFHSQPGCGLLPPGAAANGNVPSQWPQGIPSATGVMLGHRRLSIIDLSGGRQPIGNEDGSIQVILNGEIYNYRELAEELKSRGHHLATSSDTEVIVHLYEEHGDDCVQRLRGMFVFALWDNRRRRLLLARDRLGQKPLFYRHAAGRLDFGSELKSLLQLEDAPREIDPIAVHFYLTYQYVPHPLSILSSYQKLPPASVATFENGDLNVRRYWRPPYESDIAAEIALTDDWKGEAPAAAKQQSALRETLTEAVRLRMRSDVPLGAFLSGGVDSTIIAGLMQEISEQSVHTFSIGFPVARFDETSYARQASKHLGTIHHEKIVEPAALSILPKLIWHYDEPFSDSSAIPTMYLSEMTREFVTVSLSGDGGDELFAGYDRYKAVRIAAMLDRLPGPLKKLLTARIWQKLPASTEQRTLRRRLKRLLEAYGHPPQRRYLRWVSIFDEDRRQQLLDSQFLDRLNGHDSAEFLVAAYDECPNRDFVTQTTCTDLLTYLPCDILTKVDIASMAYSLEARSPFLDHRVAELAARLPINSKLRGKQGKRILVETFRDLLPADIQTRPKMGFGVPLDHWFRNELKPLLHDILLDDTSLGRGWFRPEGIRQLVDEHSRSEWDHSYRLWNLLVFELWQRTFRDGSTAPSGPAELDSVSSIHA